MLKILISVLMVLLLASLTSGLFFLMVDRGKTEKKRLFTSLGVRLALGICLLCVVLFGVITGELGHNNPWDNPVRVKSEQNPENSTEKSEK